MLQHLFKFTLVSTLALGLLACDAKAPKETMPPEGKALTVYLVRHAEKETGDDPALTAAGQERAAALAQTLGDSTIQAIHSTNYQRTRQTAAPLAKSLGLIVELYDPRDLPAMAQKLQAAGGCHVVVGHSNTTPQLVQLLGGEPGPEIVEATEYNRLYVVTRSASGKVQSQLLRYGPPNPQE